MQRRFYFNKMSFKDIPEAVISAEMEETFPFVLMTFCTFVWLALRTQINLGSYEINFNGTEMPACTV